MRKLATYEGIFESGHVRLPPNSEIPGKTGVYVLVPDAETLSARYVVRPHLGNPQQAKDFQKQVIEDATKPACDSDLFTK
jgi:hypothetical protein